MSLFCFLNFDYCFITTTHNGTVNTWVGGGLHDFPRLKIVEVQTPCPPAIFIYAPDFPAAHNLTFSAARYWSTPEVEYNTC